MAALRSLSDSQFRRSLVLLISAILLGTAWLFTVTHFVVGKRLFNSDLGNHDPGGVYVTDPLIYSLHLAALWMGGLGLLWIGLSSHRGVTGRHLLVAVGLTFVLGSFLFTMPDRGYDTDYPAFFFGVGLAASFLLTYALASLPILLPRLRLESRGGTKISPGKTPTPWTRLSYAHHWHLAGAWIGILFMWLIFGLWVTLDNWQPNRGFNTPLKYLLGGTLPLLPATAGLMMLMHMGMSLRARRNLYWILLALLGVVVLIQGVLAVNSLRESPLSLFPVAIVLVVHSWAVWAMLYLLEPCYGWVWVWSRRGQGST